jgi:hypothetical protein
MRTFVVRTVSSVAALCVCASACAAVEPISGGTGGYCVIARDGSPDVSQPDDYTFDGPTGLIRLKTVGSWDLVYQSTDTPGDPTAVPVNVRRIEQNVSGDGDLTVRANGANLAAPIYFPSTAFSGAKTIMLNLTGSFLSGAGINAPDFTLTDCVIGGDVPAASNGITASTVTDTSGVGLQIGGEMADWINLGADNVGGSITIGVLSGTLQTAHDCSSAFNIPQLPGKLIIGSPAAGGSFSGTMQGESWLASEVPSCVNIRGDITSSASILLNGDWGQHLSAQNIAGLIEINGSSVRVSDDPLMGGMMNISGTLDNEIRIHGRFESVVNVVNEISITDVMGTGGAVTVDWNGYDAGDDWMSGAQVAVHASTYRSDNWWLYAPGSHVYRTTCLKGDCNNDNAVNGYDIDPFVMILTGYEEGSDYDLAYPGLRGSALFHADLNCDGAVNGYDIDPFTLKLTDPEAWADQYPDCAAVDCTPPAGGESLAAGGAGAMGSEEGEGGLLPSDAAGFAAALETYVDGERMPALISAIEDVAAEMAGTERGEFWAAVLAELE